MLFSLISLIGLVFVARRLGWNLSKVLLHPASPLILLPILSLMWGGLIAVAVRALINWQEPNVIIKWIFGFGAGAYAAIPNYGLLSTNLERITIIPQDPYERLLLLRDSMIETISFMAYVGVSIYLSYWVGSFF